MSFYLVSYMLCVTNKLFMLTAIMLNIIMLSVLHDSVTNKPFILSVIYEERHK